MGERKVLSKYYPPDFDPSKLPRVQKKRQNDDAVRFMLPMSVRCLSCGEFMGTGLKFNARKADTSDTYLGIRIFRFTMRCKGCPSSFVIRTDPKNSDYECESGVRRNFEPWKHEQKQADHEKHERSEQDQDTVRALENRTNDEKARMDELDNLQAILTANAQRSKLEVHHLIQGRQKSIQHQDDKFTKEADILLNKAREQPNPSSIHSHPQPPDLPNTSPAKGLFARAKVRVRVHKKIAKSRKGAEEAGLPSPSRNVPGARNTKLLTSMESNVSKFNPLSERARNSDQSEREDKHTAAPLATFTDYASSSSSSEDNS